MSDVIQFHECEENEDNFKIYEENLGWNIDFDCYHTIWPIDYCPFCGVKLCKEE